MSPTIVYVYPLNGAGDYFDCAFHFLESYHRFPPGLPHNTVVVCNGAKLNSETEILFSSLPNVRFLEHDNSGYDIGAFQHAARDNPCELMVFLGNSAYVRGPGWLKRMADAFQKHGSTLYGSMENSGDRRFGVEPHLRTTGFWMPTELFNSYPVTVQRPEQRYPFEHGKDCLTSWCVRQRRFPLVVTWSGEYGRERWGKLPEGFHRGRQADLITGDRLSQPPFYPTP